MLLVFALVSCTAVFTAVGPVAGAADLPTLGTLTFTPATGTAVDPVSMTTVSSGSATGCPAGSTYVQALAVGPGGWATGIIVLGATSAGVSTSGDFGEPLSDNFAGIASANAIQILAGRYDITMTCQNSLGTTKYGVFTGSLWFTDSTHYQSTAPGTATTTSTTTTTTTTIPDITTTTTTIPGSTTTTTSGSTPMLGTLTFAQHSGTDIDPITLHTASTGTPKGCPAAATNISGMLVGPGAWADGVVGVQNTSAGVSSSADFDVYLVDTMNGIASGNGLTIVAGRYDVTLRCQNNLGSQVYGVFTTSLWFTDATHWQDADPNNSQTVTLTSVTVAPADRADLGAAITLTATVTPATAAGSIQFRELSSGSYTRIGTAVALSGGRATLTRRDFAFGLHEWSAVFTPSDTAAYASSTSGDVVFVVALPLPPLPPAAAVLTGSPKVGATLRCQGAFRNARSLAYQWLRDRTLLDSATKTTYRVAATDVKARLRCRILATNTGGTTSRTSRATALVVAR